MTRKPPSPDPSRPRLADHVAARCHQIGGRRRVVLHDTEAGGVVLLGEREWGLLRFADGSRDLEGIAAAAGQLGYRASLEALVTLLGALQQAGLLASGVGAGPPPPEPRPDPNRPLLPLAGYRLRCHGGGTCCRLYPTTTFAPGEVARARVLAPEVLDLGDDPGRAFTPQQGSESPPWAACAVAMVDGRCALLSAAGRCTLHERGGALAKPHGCRQFPLTLVDDGRAIRVSVAPECACVLDGATGEGTGGEPLLAPGATRAADLDARTHVEVLAADLPIAAALRWSRERYLGWLDALEGRLGDPELDVAALLWSAAVELRHGGSADAGSGIQAPRGVLFAAAVEELGRAVERRIAVDGWRAESDLARQLPHWMLDALRKLDGREPVVQPEVERFYLRALVHGRTLVPSGERLDRTLGARALRLWLGRRLGSLPAFVAGAASDPALRQPLALVEAYARGFGLG